MTDNKGRTVDFKNTILIMTSNVGAEVVQEYMQRISGADESSRDGMLEECRRNVIDILKHSMRPEFINRIDEIIMFEPLTKKDIMGIVDMQLAILKKKMTDNGIDISFTDAFREYISEKGFDPAYGARPVKRIIQRELVNMLAKSLLNGEISRDSKVVIDVSGGEIVIKG